MNPLDQKLEKRKSNLNPPKRPSMIPQQFQEDSLSEEEDQELIA